MIQRVRNWDVGLTVWAQSVLGQPFRWGETDCASLVRRAHRVMYGIDLFRDIPAWDSLLGARRVLEAHGTVEDQLRRLGARQLPMTYATQGDVVYHPAVAEGDLTGSAFVVVASRLLSANPGRMVELWDRTRLQSGAVLLRMPG